MSVPDPLPELRLQATNYTVYHFLAWRDRNDFDLDAPYQRGSVWSVDQRRNLIKSILMGLPIGTLVVSALPYRDGGASWRIVDGKQRIEAVRAFAEDEFLVPGWWFPVEDLKNPLRRVGEVRFSDLAPRGQRGFENSPLGAIEFSADLEFSPNPRYDASLQPGYPEYKANPDKVNRYTTRHRTDDEILRAEAELYLLVNFGGVEQTDADRARAEQIAGAS